MTRHRIAHRIGLGLGHAAQLLGLEAPAARLARRVVDRWATPEQRAHVDELEQRRRTRDETPASDLTQRKDK